MSYWKKIEYEIVPRESFTVIRGCSGCGRKTHFGNTKKFRVNANGNKLDVWLIYQCETCRHTLNLTIYERKTPFSIPKEEYDRFLENDEALAESFGRDLSLFQKNKAQVDQERIGYDIVERTDGAERKSAGNDITSENEGSDIASGDGGNSILLTIYNSYGLKIRPEKQLAELLGYSRSRMQKMLREGKIEWETDSPQVISVRMSERLFEQAGRADEPRDETIPESRN